MKRTMLVSVGVAVLAAVAMANAQIGPPPGANPSNPQDLRGRSNPQDLTAPGGSNRQDLVRRPPSATSGVTTPPRVTAPRYTKKTKAKPKLKAKSKAATKAKVKSKASTPR
jgi:hypothetical protein